MHTGPPVLASPGIGHLLPFCTPHQVAIARAHIPTCTSHFRAWGWESGRSCAYRSTPTTAASTSTAKAVASAASTAVTTVTAAAAPSTPTIYSAGGSVSSAPSCGSAPTMGTSQPDNVGYVWGWENGRGACVRVWTCLVSAVTGYGNKLQRVFAGDLWRAGGARYGRGVVAVHKESIAPMPTVLPGFPCNTGCVFRNSEGMPVYYAALITGT